MRLLRVAAALWILAVLAGCSDDGDRAASEQAATTTPTTMARLGSTLPFETQVVEDLVVVGLEGIYGPDGATLVTFTDDERACIDGQAAGTPELAAVVAPPGTVDDPDMEQLVAVIVVDCVDIGRIGPVVVEELVPNIALEGVDRACIEREVAALQDSPDELAGVLAGDPPGIAAIARVVAANCA